MDKTASGSDITLTVYHAYNDLALDVKSIKYTVYDATGVVIYTSTDPVTLGSGETNVVIDGDLNKTTAKYDIRSVKFELTTDSGTYVINQFYEIEGDVLKLTPFVDSFMTFSESMLVKRRLSLPTPYFDALEDDDKAVALENAYGRLAALRYGCLAGTQSLLDLDFQQVLALDPGFVEALKKAQLLEANHLVEVNPVKDKIRAGIISETIGESSMFFKQNGVDTRSIYPGISDDAYPLLGKYLWRETTNAQIWKLRRS
jgi:hypothetical protein